MTELSDRNGDIWQCTSFATGGSSRFSQLTGTSLSGGLNFVGQGRHGGDEKVGDADEEGGNGDQKRNARKRKHASKDQEGKRDNEEGEKSNGDKKPKAARKKLNCVAQARHGGDEKVGDAEEEDGNGDQKRNARKRKHASKDHEGKRDNEEDEKSNGDKKPKASKKKSAQNGDHSTDANGDPNPYYRRDFQPSRRSNVSNSERCSDGAHAGLINSDVICYSNAIFQNIASCAHSNLCKEFLRSQPSEEHQHFKIYYEFKSLISSILRNGMDNIDPSKFIGLYKERYTNVGANEGKWHGNFNKQCIYIFKCIFN
jgi:hypothetical protein